MSKKKSDGSVLARIANTPLNNASSKTAPRQIFQNDYAKNIWGFNSKKEQKLISALTEDDGSVLIAVHGVFTDSIIESNEAKQMAMACGLRSYISFESRKKPWRGIQTLSPWFYDNAMGIYYTQTAHEVFSLMDCITQIYTATHHPPVVIAHSRGALLLTKAAVLWKGLNAIDDHEDNKDIINMCTNIPGFVSLWKKLSDKDKKALLNNKTNIRNSSIITITECPAVPGKDSSWKFLKKWSTCRVWNFHTSKDWFLIFTRNPSRGYIPALDDHNILFHLYHHSFSGSLLVQKVIASLWENGKVLGEALDMLIEHHIGRSKLASEILPVDNK